MPWELRRFSEASSLCDLVPLLSLQAGGRNTGAWRIHTNGSPSLLIPLQLLPRDIRHQHAILHLLHLLPWTADTC